jgi:hypothetical protein
MNSLIYGSSWSYRGLLDSYSNNIITLQKMQVSYTVKFRQVESWSKERSRNSLLKTYESIAYQEISCMSFHR